LKHFAAVLAVSLEEPQAPCGKQEPMATEVQAIVKFIRKVAATRSVKTSTDAQLLSRFVPQRDESAFAALVERHGPMVFAVCRRILRESHDCEDAYQATFLVLARKANSVAQPETLGNWLYGVACRTALRARTKAAKHHEQQVQQVVAHTEREPVDELIMKEIRQLLDEELNHLPAKYRAPFVLCYLSGQTHEEIASALGCPRKTVTTRLMRARQRLRGRLVRRGVTLAAGTFAALLSEKSLIAEGLPIPDVSLTTRAALQFVTNATITTGTVSAPVAALAKGVLISMTLTRIKMLGAILLVATLFGSSAGLFAFHALAAGKDGKHPAGTKETPKARSVNEQVRFDLDKEKEEKLAKELFEGTVATVTAIGGSAGSGGLLVFPALAGGEDDKQAPEKKKKSDKELLQGTWVEESRGADGKKVAEGDRWKLVFDEDKVTWKDKNKDREGTFTIDPDQKPKEIDLTFADPTLTLNGIYELKDDTLKALWRENDRGGLPKTLDPKEGFFIVLKKKKAE
jgi:RNA polymerase sigma factor (sigma-70 family)